MAKQIIDVCCGSRMFWFDKEDPDVEFCDKRELSVAKRFGQKFNAVRHIEIHPTTKCDFTALPFENDSFYLAVFDPPHLLKAGEKSWLAMKYGTLDDNWPKMLHDGFWECMRVLKPNGTLIFKWSEVQIPLKDVLKAINAKPLFGNRSGKHMNTHWLCFMKGITEVEQCQTK